MIASIFAPAKRVEFKLLNVFGHDNKVITDMRLFAKEVMPELRKLGSDPLFDTELAAPAAFLAA